MQLLLAEFMTMLAVVFIAMQLILVGEHHIFEKMLYNQALLSRVFLEAWEASGKTSYRRAAERAFQYVTRDMTSPSGAFYAAEGADSLNNENQIEEGAFYTWQSDELFKSATWQF